jgi:septum site-determining protein MinD
LGIGLTLASGKGGTGKTTVVANLAIALAQFGRDVTLLDADIEMANLEIHLGMEGMETTLNTALSGDAPIKDAVYNGPAGIKVIPAGIPLERLRKVDPDRLESVLREIMGTTEILLIDAPAGLGKSAIISIATSQKVILVANPDITSMSDALKTRLVAEKLGSDIVGVVLNRVSGNPDQYGELSVGEVETILEYKVLAVVPEDPKFKLALAYGMPAILRFPNAPGPVAIKKLAADLIGETYTPPVVKDYGFLRRLVRGLSLVK